MLDILSIEATFHFTAVHISIMINSYSACV